MPGSEGSPERNLVARGPPGRAAAASQVEKKGERREVTEDFSNTDPRVYQQPLPVTTPDRPELGERTSAGATSLTAIDSGLKSGEFLEALRRGRE
jgi:hypothetical protein